MLSRENFPENNMVLLVNKGQFSWLFVRFWFIFSVWIFMCVEGIIRLTPFLKFIGRKHAIAAFYLVWIKMIEQELKSLHKKWINQYHVLSFLMKTWHNIHARTLIFINMWNHQSILSWCIWRKRLQYFPRLFLNRNFIHEILWFDRKALVSITL